MKYFFVFLLIVGCATNSKTLTKKGEIRLKGGKHHALSWNDTLLFERNSWFFELTMMYDSMTAKIDKNSPFYNWFSESEKRVSESCVDMRVAMTLAHDSAKISDRMFKQEWLNSGYEAIAVPEFKRNVSLHSDFQWLNLQTYSVYLLCRKGVSIGEEEVSVSFPGFNTIKISVK